MSDVPKPNEHAPPPARVHMPVVHGMVIGADGKAHCVDVGQLLNKPPAAPAAPAGGDAPASAPAPSVIYPNFAAEAFGMVVNPSTGIATCQSIPITNPAHPAHPAPAQAAAPAPAPVAAAPAPAPAPASSGAASGLPINDAFVTQLIELGFTRVRAENAVYLSGNSSVEAAATYLVDHMNDYSLDLPLTARLSGRQPSNEIKMVLVVRQDLNLSVGKTAAQCGHAAVHLYRKMSKKFPDFLKRWEGLGETKIVLMGKDAAQLTGLGQQAEALGLPWCFIADAGRTEIAPGTQTVLGIAGPVDTVNLITGHLRLLK